MNIEQTKKAIEVMQSFVDGKEIRSDSGLTFNGENQNNPVWNWSSVNYFVKPEPRVFWMNIHQNKNRFTYDSYEFARSGVTSDIETIKLIEVIE